MDHSKCVQNGIGGVTGDLSHHWRNRIGLLESQQEEGAEHTHKKMATFLLCDPGCAPTHCMHTKM